MVTGLHPRCPLPPNPNPPPRRGEGRVGVIFLMSFLQCLGHLTSHPSIDLGIVPFAAVSVIAKTHPRSPAGAILRDHLLIEGDGL
jgi:hypothetical protein